MTIEVERLAEDRLRRQLWAFDLFMMGGGLTVKVAKYCWQERATPRHKWKNSGRGFSRFDNRGYGGEWGMPSWDVPLPEDVREEAKRQVADLIVIPEKVAPHPRDPRPCPHCQRTFTDDWSLSRHIESFHAGETANAS